MFLSFLEFYFLFGKDTNVADKMWLIFADHPTETFYLPLPIRIQNRNPKENHKQVHHICSQVIRF